MTDPGQVEIDEDHKWVEQIATNIRTAIKHEKPPAQQIPIGILASLGGTMAGNEAPVASAILMAISEINASNGGIHLNGLPQRIFPKVLNGNSRPSEFKKQASKYFTECPESRAVFGCWTSASRKAVGEVARSENILLIYPVQFEGLEQSARTIYTGSVPNQQIYPALDWWMSELSQGSRQIKCLAIGSDYIYPRAATVLAHNHWMKSKHVWSPPHFIPYTQEGKDDPGQVKSVDEAIARIQLEKPDLILNFINGDTNEVFFDLRHRAGLASIPTVSFSLTPIDVASMEPVWFDQDYLSVGYLEPLEPTPESFAARYKIWAYKHSVHSATGHVTTDSMWNAYAGTHLWARAVEKAGSPDGPAVRTALAQNPRFELCGDELNLDPETLYACKRPRMGRIRRAGDRAVVEPVEMFPPLEIAPRPFPSEGTREEWTTYILALSFVSDILNTLDAYADADKIRTLLLKSDVLSSPKTLLTAWWKFVSDSTEFPDGSGKQRRCFEMFRSFDPDIHSLQQLRGSNKKSIPGDCVKTMLNLIGEFGCCDEDLVELRGTGGGDLNQSLQFAKAKAVSYRHNHKLYLFDLLDYARAKLRHTVLLGTNPIRTLGDLAALFHDDLNWQHDHTKHWEVFKALGWVDGPGTEHARISHHLETIAGSGGLPVSVRYSMIARNNPKPGKSGIGPLIDSMFSPDAPLGDTSTMLKTMQYLFRGEIPGYCVVHGEFDKQTWLEHIKQSPGARLWLFHWKKKATDKAEDLDASHLVLAGTRCWAPLVW